jgi:hypothetical protein
MPPGRLVALLICRSVARRSEEWLPRADILEPMIAPDTQERQAAVGEVQKMKRDRTQNEQKASLAQEKPV